MENLKFKNKYGSVDINALINYKAWLQKKAIRTNESFLEYLKEFYSSQPSKKGVKHRLN